MINRVLGLIANEPVLAIAVVFSAVLAVFGVVVDASTLVVLITAVAPALAGTLQRTLVTPVGKLSAVVTDVEETVDEVADEVEELAAADDTPVDPPVVTSDAT